MAEGPHTPSTERDREGFQSMGASTRDVFAPFRAAAADRPFVVAQLGLSLDGRIATPTGESRGLNGDAALDHLHRIRANVDAVVVGAGTIAVDDPQLNVRRAAGVNPARVVIDPTGRTGGAARWLNRDGARLLLVTAADCAPDGVELVRLPATDGAIAPRAIVAALYERGLRRLLVEGGARTISNFIDAGCVDRLHILMAPVILGSGKSGLELAPIAGIDQALRPPTEIFLLPGGEVVFDCDLGRAR
jgi:diaminohydroxyphosphoribosylaminopyrimidine deaminase / 5-amino-6-(5-phosphoribosylamino)uracil reductase